LVKNQVWY